MPSPVGIDIASFITDHGTRTWWTNDTAVKLGAKLTDFNNPAKVHWLINVGLFSQLALTISSFWRVTLQVYLSYS